MELGSQHTGSAGGGGLAQLLQGSPLFGNNHLDDEVVPNAHSARAIHVAKGVVRNVASGSEFAIDVALDEICLPSRLDFLACNGAGVVVEYAFAFATNFAGMLGASGRDGLLGLFDAPVELTETPS